MVVDSFIMLFFFFLSICVLIYFYARTQILCLSSQLWIFQLFLKDCLYNIEGYPSGSMVRNIPANAGDETWVQSLDGEGPLEEDMVTHPGILARKILWTEKPGGLQSMESQRVGHD